MGYVLYLISFCFLIFADYQHYIEYALDEGSALFGGTKVSLAR